MRAALLLPLTALLLRWRGLGFCLRAAHGRLDRSRAPVLGEGEQRDVALQVLDSVDRANRRYSLLSADCLPLSLVSWYLARRLGCPMDFRLGVRTLTGRFEAHAWVELRGEPLGEAEDVARIYATFDLDRFERSIRSH